MKKYHLSDIISITTGHLVSTRHMEGIYDILNYMTGDNLFTHQLPRACDECSPEILKQHPQLSEINGQECNSENWQDWLNGLIKKYGEFLPIEPLKTGKHEFKNPIQEAEELVGKDKVIICFGG